MTRHWRGLWQSHAAGVACTVEVKAVAGVACIVETNADVAVA